MFNNVGKPYFQFMILILVQLGYGQNLIVNGGFEDKASLDSKCILTFCETTDTRIIEPWVLTGTVKEWRMTGLSLPTTEGLTSMNLNRIGFSIGQKIQTTVSAVYKATFQLNIHPCNIVAPRSGYIKASGSPRVII
jgi:hypothetical protein